MKITLGEILNGKNSLEKLISKEIKIKTAFKLSKLAKMVTEEMQLYEEQRIGLVKKYGDEPDEKGATAVKPENNQKFIEELTELTGVEVELDFEPISVDELGDIEISAGDLSLIEKFLSE